MPIYNFWCPTCEKPVKRLLPFSSLAPVYCPVCKDTMSRDATGPTSQTVNVRDNGVMPRKVEQLEGIDEMVRDRSTGPKDSGTI